MSENATARVASRADLFSGDAAFLESALAKFLEGQRWFAGKSAGIADVSVADVVALGAVNGAEFFLLFANVVLNDRSIQHYAIPISTVADNERDSTKTILTFLVTGSGQSRQAVIEASGEPSFWRRLLASAVQTNGTEKNLPIRFVPADSMPMCEKDRLSELPVEIHEAEQSNSSILLGGEYFLKMFRRPTSDINPDVEIGSFLTANDRFQNAPAVAGHVEYRPAGGHPECLGVISALVSATGDAWSFTLARIDEFWQRLFLSQKLLEEMPLAVESSVTSCGEVLPDEAELIGEFLHDAALLGRRTAELHIALASDSQSIEFCPEPATVESVRKHLAAIRREAEATAALLESAGISRDVSPELARQIHGRSLAKLDEFEAAAAEIRCCRIRVHGDYHLGQILRTTDDFVIIDFEGEPDRPISERREKRSAMKDVAGLVRSLHYAACAGAAKLIPALDDGRIPDSVTAWQNFWFGCSARSFLKGYFESASGQVFLPEITRHRQQLLDLYLLEKSLYELRYELNNRPDWVAIPLAGLRSVLGLQS